MSRNNIRIVRKGIHRWLLTDRGKLVVCRHRGGPCGGCCSGCWHCPWCGSCGFSQVKLLYHLGSGECSVFNEAPVL
jgi:hypothetical protein